MARTTDKNVQQRSHAVTVAIASVATFLVLLAFLLIRLESGRDPAIAVGEHTAPGTQKRTLVLERRIVKTSRANDQLGVQPSTTAAAPTPIPDNTPAPVTRQS